MWPGEGLDDVAVGAEMVVVATMASYAGELRRYGKGAAVAGVELFGFRTFRHLWKCSVKRDTSVSQ